MEIERNQNAEKAVTITYIINKIAEGTTTKIHKQLQDARLSVTREALRHPPVST